MKILFFEIFKQNARYLRKTVFKPYLKTACMRAIRWYQTHLSKHTCMFRPTCSQYTMESINNRGVIAGILLGTWRILRCNPWVEPYTYDPAPEKRSAKWVM